jgi:hypothetical protein
MGWPPLISTGQYQSDRYKAAPFLLRIVMVRAARFGSLGRAQPGGPRLVVAARGGPIRGREAHGDAAGGNIAGLRCHRRLAQCAQKGCSPDASGMNLQSCRLGMLTSHLPGGGAHLRRGFRQSSGLTAKPQGQAPLAPSPGQAGAKHRDMQTQLRPWSWPTSIAPHGWRSWSRRGSVSLVSPALGPEGGLGGWELCPRPATRLSNTPALRQGAAGDHGPRGTRLGTDAVQPSPRGLWITSPTGTTLHPAVSLEPANRSRGGSRRHPGRGGERSFPGMWNCGGHPPSRGRGSLRVDIDWTRERGWIKGWPSPSIPRGLSPTHTRRQEPHAATTPEPPSWPSDPPPTPKSASPTPSSPGSPARTRSGSSRSRTSSSSTSCCSRHAWASS